MTNLNSNWELAKKALQNLPDNNHPDHDRLTALERLARRYRRFASVSTVLIAVMPLYFRNDIFSESWRLTLTLTFCLYFTIAAVMDWWLYAGVSRIDVVNMPVSDVATKALFYRKWHHRFIALLIPAAITLVLLLVLALTDNSVPMLAGMFAGAAFGLFIGTRQYLRFMSDYKNLQ